jgi:hypothetical protein
MPSLQLTCPFCVDHVAIQVSAVTRSRQCPNCQRQLMLQVTSRGGVVRLRAQLLGLVQGEDPPLAPFPAQAKTRMPSPSLDRNHSDWVRLRRQLAQGLGVMLAVILALIALRTCRNSPESKPAGSPAARTTATP